VYSIVELAQGNQSFNGVQPCGKLTGILDSRGETAAIEYRYLQKANVNVIRTVATSMSTQIRAEENV
jgi:nanoRNase/pAp phosphatase (c-di-AMP/oligoRNAs hydrolase)